MKLVCEKCKVKMDLTTQGNTDNHKFKRTKKGQTIKIQGQVYYHKVYYCKFCNITEDITGKNASDVNNKIHSKNLKLRGNTK